MFERFTGQSRRVIVLAQEEARNLNHAYIGTEHLLLGLLREDRGAALRALAAADITLGAAEREVEVIIGRGEQPPSGHIPFTPRAKKCLELSLREALQLGHNYIGTGHLLLGVIHEGDGVAIKVLGRLGADLGQLRDRVTTEMEEYPEDQDDPAELREVRRRVRPRDDPIRDLLDAIDTRLNSIERHLGITGQEPGARPGARPGGQSEPGAESGVGASSTGADEVARLHVEVTRLRALLREHDIDPDEPGDLPAAAS
jgi:ATP-dependent Clp protease ATP-binding subunit ClpA